MQVQACKEESHRIDLLTKPALVEGSFKGPFFLSIGWTGPSVEALIAVIVVDGGPPSADEPGRTRASEGWFTGLPRWLGRFASVPRRPGAADLRGPGAGPLELSWFWRAQAACSRVCARAGGRGRSGLQTQVRKDLLDDRLLQDGGDDLQLAIAVRGVLQVEFEHALEQPGPTQPHRALVRTVRLALGALRYAGGLIWPLRYYHRAQLGVGCRHAVETDQAQARARNPAPPAAA